MSPEAGRLYRGEPLESRRAAQRQRLLEAARDVFASAGFHAASVEDVVARAHVSRTAFYRCFANKDECLAGVLAWGAGRLAEQLGGIAQSGAEAEDKVRDGVHALVAALAADPAMARVILVEAVGATPEIERARQTARAGFAALIEGEMRRFEGWQGSTAQEISVVALATMAAVAETVSYLAATDGLRDPDAAATHLADYAVRALTPPE